MSGNAVADDPVAQRFFYTEDGAEAQLTYRVRAGRLVLVHTEVPEALGGRGVGGRLVRAAVERARASGETLVPVCPFARAWLRDHAGDTAGVRVDAGDG